MLPNGSEETFTPRKRTNEHYSLRHEIHPPPEMEIFSENTLMHCENGSRSAPAELKKTKKSDASQPKGEPDIEEIVNKRFTGLDKSFKTNNNSTEVVYSIKCSACTESLTDKTVVSCHDMPFHNFCVKMVEGKCSYHSISN
jgi:hypothetical protein